MIVFGNSDLRNLSETSILSAVAHDYLFLYEEAISFTHSTFRKRQGVGTARKNLISARPEQQERP